MSSASSEDDDDASPSMMSTSELNGSSSANSSRKRKSKSGSYFRVWRFQLIVKADLRHSNTTEGKGTLLTEHLRTRTGHSRPSCVTSLTVFCDELQFSGPSDSDDLISIQVQGYVQTKDGIPLSRMQNWIDSATWKPVPGGLSSDDEYQTNMDKFNDPNDTMTRLMVFGSVTANNAGRAADRQARKVGCLIENYHHLSFFPLTSA